MTVLKDPVITTSDGLAIRFYGEVTFDVEHIYEAPLPTLHDGVVLVYGADVAKELVITMNVKNRNEDGVLVKYWRVDDEDRSE